MKKILRKNNNKMTVLAAEITLENSDLPGSAPDRTGR